MEERKKTGGLIGSFIEYFYGNFVVLLLGFISLPLITRIMSTDEYGRTAMFSSAVSIIYIFAVLGLDQAYIRYFYKEGTDQRTLFFRCVRYPFMLIIVLSAVYALFSSYFNDFLFGKTGTDITFLVIAYTVTSVFERFLFLNIRMEQNGKLYSNLNILSKVLYIVFIFAFVYLLGDDFRVVLYSMTLPLVIVTVYLGIRFKRLGRTAGRRAHLITDRELLRYGIPFLPMLLMEWLLSSMDKWSIKIFNDFSETGIYSAAMQIMTVIMTLKITFVAFWAPIAMEKYENEEEEAGKAFFKDIFDKVQFLCLCAAFGITILRGVIVLILGEGYRDAIRIIPFLTLMPILSMLFEMTGQGIKFKERVVYFNYASLTAIICNLTGNTLLVPRLRGVGAALATAVTYIVYFAIGTYFSEKCYKVGYDYRCFIISLLLYIGYAFHATFSHSDILISAVFGTILLFIHVFINRRTLTGLIKVFKESVLKEGIGK
ncbi:MAG: oligosaccharide flippase family protein [Lachnospiraceae bacterium]|nr:oligosaccharide flippase family protein [Lachnospiraceae bacterium]